MKIKMLHYNDYLVHDGQKGMHWGIRKYRNYDGTLTPAGKIRYDYSEGGHVEKKKLTRAERKAAKAKEKEKKAKAKEREAKKTAEELKKKQEELAEEQKKAAKERTEMQKLSNEELKAAIERLNLERQYAQLVNPPAPKVETAPKVSKVERAKNFLGQLAGAGQSVASLYDSYQKIDKIRHPDKYEKQDPLKALKQLEEKERLKSSIDKAKYDTEARNRSRAKWASDDADAKSAATKAKSDAAKEDFFRKAASRPLSGLYSERRNSQQANRSTVNSWFDSSGLANKKLADISFDPWPTSSNTPAPVTRSNTPAPVTRSSNLYDMNEFAKRHWGF